MGYMGKMRHILSNYFDLLLELIHADAAGHLKFSKCYAAYLVVKLETGLEFIYPML